MRASLLLPLLLASLAGCRARREPPASGTAARADTVGTSGGPAEDATPSARPPLPSAPTTIEDAAAPPASEDPPRPRLLAADPVPGWTAADVARAYLPEDLHLLVDGGDGVFLHYGVRWATRRSYRNARRSNRMVRVEWYAFADAAGARGRFEHDAAALRQEETTAAPRIETVRLEGDRAQVLHGRHLVLVAFEDEAETDPEALLVAAAEALPAFVRAVGTWLERADEAQEEP
jgi:hypothetical protein